MRKFLLIIGFLIFLSGIATTKEISITLKGGYFNPSEKAFRDIYGEGIMYGGEASICVWKALEVWFGASYFSKKGELTFTKEETKLRIVPIGAGVKYFFPVVEILDGYGGVGINHYSYKEENPIGKVAKNGLGILVKAGGLVKVIKGIIIDFYINYSYCRMKPADFDINIGGFETGIGLGYKF